MFIVTHRVFIAHCCCGFVSVRLCINTVYSFVLLCLYCCTTLVHCVSLLPSLNMVLRVFRKGFVIDKRICVNVCMCVCVCYIDVTIAIHPSLLQL